MSRPREIAAKDVVAMLRPGMRVFCCGGMSHPSRIVEAINSDPERSAGVEFWVSHPPGFSQPHLRAPRGRVVVFFRRPDLQDAAEVELVPGQYRRLFDLVAGIRFDLVLLQAAAVETGRPSYGLGVDFAPAALRNAVNVVVEINQLLPAPVGAPRLPEAPASFFVESSEPPPTADSRVDAVARQVGELIASRIRDGDCVQMGIGAIPEAVFGALDQHNDLGVHSGMISDGVASLARLGVVTGARKSIDRGKIVTGFVLGSSELYEWANSAPQLQFAAVDYTHDQAVLFELDNLVVVNSAIEVDLLGQVNAEAIDGRQVSGTGGSVDFFRAAQRSRCGRSFVALPATTKAGASRIVPLLEGGSVTTALRTDIGAVVTEFGIAELDGRSVKERARALIEIAHPDHRNQLGETWKRIGVQLG